MLETLEILFVQTPIELRVIILGCIVMGILLEYKDFKEKKKKKWKK